MNKDIKKLAEILTTILLASTSGAGHLAVAVKISQLIATMAAEKRGWKKEEWDALFADDVVKRAALQLWLDENRPA